MKRPASLVAAILFLLMAIWKQGGQTATFNNASGPEGRG